jgi:hypothetical protein
MRRREFIALLGGVVAAWPFAACAQQAANRIPLIAAITPLSEDDPEAQARVAAFRQALQDLRPTRSL